MPRVGMLLVNSVLVTNLSPEKKNIKNNVLQNIYLSASKCLKCPDHSCLLQQYKVGYAGAITSHAISMYKISTIVFSAPQSFNPLGKLYIQTLKMPEKEMTRLQSVQLAI